MNQPRRDDEGHLIDPDDWTPELVSELTAEESITLSGDHRSVQDFIRAYQADHGITPEIRHAAKHLAE